MKTVNQFTKFNECPAEWAGETVDKNLFHIKYLDGMLIVSLDKSRMVHDYGDVNDCKMTTDQMRRLTKGILKWG